MYFSHYLYTYIFFLTPFLPPLESPLFLPTAMIKETNGKDFAQFADSGSHVTPASRKIISKLSNFDIFLKCRLLFVVVSCCMMRFDGFDNS